jgi:hypothetical protein
VSNVFHLVKTEYTSVFKKSDTVSVEKERTVAGVAQQVHLNYPYSVIVPSIVLFLSDLELLHAIRGEKSQKDLL